MRDTPTSHWSHSTAGNYQRWKHIWFWYHGHYKRHPIIYLFSANMLKYLNHPFFLHVEYCSCWRVWGKMNTKCSQVNCPLQQMPKYTQYVATWSHCLFYYRDEQVSVLAGDSCTPSNKCLTMKCPSQPRKDTCSSLQQKKTMGPSCYVKDNLFLALNAKPLHICINE